MRTMRQRQAAERRSAAQWKAIVEEWQGTGETANAFCEARGLSLKSLKWWRWSLTVHAGALHQGSPGFAGPVQGARRSMVPASGRTTPTFVELVQRAPVKNAVAPFTPSVEVIVPGDRGERRIRVAPGFDAATLRQVVQALEQGVTEEC